MNTQDIINNFYEIYRKRIIGKFRCPYQKIKPDVGDVDIIIQRRKTVYCIEIKEVKYKNQYKKLSEGIEQLKKDKDHMNSYLVREHLVESTKILREYNQIKLILIMIISGKGYVYLFGDSIGNKDVALKKTEPPVPYEEFITNIGKYLNL